MTVYLAGIAQTRCMEHPKADEIDVVAAAVLTAMAWPAMDNGSKGKGARFICSESIAKIAKRARCERKAAMRAQERLADLGVIECLRSEPKKPKHWYLALLAQAWESPEHVPERDKAAQGDISPRGTSLVPERDKTCTSEGHNPSDSSRPQGREGEEDSGTADAVASARAPAPAAAPSTSPSPSPLVAKVMKELGYTQPVAESWIEDRVALAKKAGTIIRSHEAYVGTTCIQTELAKRAGLSEGKAERRPASPASAKTAKAPAGKKSATPKRRPLVDDVDKRDAVFRVLDGVAAEKVAEQYGVKAETVRTWCRNVERQEFYAAAKKRREAADQPHLQAVAGGAR